MKFSYVSIIAIAILTLFALFGCGGEAVADDPVVSDASVSQEMAVSTSNNEQPVEKPLPLVKLEQALGLLGKSNKAVFETLGEYEDQSPYSNQVFRWSGRNGPGPERNTWRLQCELDQSNRAVAFSWTFIDRAYDENVVVHEELTHNRFRDFSTLYPSKLERLYVYPRPRMGGGIGAYFMAAFLTTNDGNSIRLTGYSTSPPGTQAINYQTNQKELKVRGIGDLGNAKLTGWFIGSPTDSSMGDPQDDSTITIGPYYRSVPISDSQDATASVSKGEGSNSGLICPVCRKAVGSIEKAASHVDYDGKRYFLCTSECVKKWELNPAKYAKGGYGQDVLMNGG